MSEFKIGQFRYTWRGAWVTGTAYKRDDVVTVGGFSYVSVVTHTAAADFFDDLNFIAQGETQPTPRWVVMTQSAFSWRGDWQDSEKYNLGDVVLNGGVLYACIDDHTSGSDIDGDLANWEIYASFDSFREDWLPSTRYSVGEVVVYNGIVYRCTTGHTSADISDGLELDQAKWTIYFQGIQYRGVYAFSTRYRENDLVTYNGSVLRCIEGYTSDSAGFDSAKWQIEFFGSEFDREWAADIYYGVGSVVTYGGHLYYAIEANYDDAPINSVLASSTAWELLARGTNFRGIWTQNTSYKTGDVVRQGGNLYVNVVDQETDGSTFGFDLSDWDLLVPGQNWRREWNQNNQIYSLNDLVIFEGDVYKCVVIHVSDGDNFPNNGNGFSYWQLLIEAIGKQGMRERGDLLTYDLSNRLGLDGSTFGPTAVPIGLPGELLSIDAEDRVVYENVGSLSRTFYVSAEGIDDAEDPLRGINQYKSWRTVRFACEQANDGFEGTTTVSVATGLYEEVLPIIVPKKTAIVGAELRSTTIVPKGPNPLLANDYTFSIASLARISTVLSSLLLGLSVPKTAGNPLNPSSATKTILVNIPFNPPEFDLQGNELYQGQTEEIVEVEFTSPQSLAKVETLISQIIQYIDFFLGDGETNPAVTGSNSLNIDQNDISAQVLLEANKDFLAEEAVAWMRATFPAYNFDSASCKRDVRAYVDAWIYDLKYLGNYRSILAARYYRNAVLGSVSEDMFYCRDSSGIRNATVKGLEGVLNPPGVFDLYRRPVGGSYVSLDPGWGPADESVWIINRSPYIQNVTTVGYGVVGQKIDGALHNGGNKSIVSNDFTQVLSDGVGAWVLNNGRAELVSVFTYYCAVGYLAENGGVIRATNGNCSYGRYGTIADGIDGTEIPLEVTVNNRNQDAIVASTFAGEFNDEVQAFEYANCGQNYTQATASIVGSGVGAQVKFDEFRDNAVFQARLLDISTTIAQTIGGSGYSIAQNNAQPNLTPGGDATTITIASNDPNEQSDYLGKRLIITGGTGTGQYGYISAYNSSTKVATIRRESDDELGWDHVVSGTAIKIPLDTTTFYRIEPRVIFSEPQFLTEELTVDIVVDWAAMAYGETYRVFNNIEPTISEEDEETVVGSESRFRVTKIGRTYGVTLLQGGVNYNPGDRLIIEGSEIDGNDRNTIEITVLSVTEDSTRAIINFRFSGVASSGTFVALPSSGTAFVYSRDGETWSEPAFMPSAGNWKCLAAVSEPGQSQLSGNVRFVAIRNNSNLAASSQDGITWSSRTMPANRQWNGVAYGGGKFVAVAGDQNGSAYSTNGINWTASSMPVFGDSTVNTWVDVAYGKNRFVAVANSGNIAASSSDGITWTGTIMDAIDDSSQRDWIGVAYGNDRFVAISSQGDVAYSFDGQSWAGSSLPVESGYSGHTWRKIKYANGVFFAIGDNEDQLFNGSPTDPESNFAATSPDGIYWTSRTLDSTEEWRALCFGNPYEELEDSAVGLNTPKWILAGRSDKFNKVRTGARAKGRVTVGGGVIGQLRIWDPGSGYIDAPTITLIDPNVGTPAEFEVRTADGVLPNPSWINRGTGYRSVSTRVTVSGNGFADVIPAGKFVTISGLSRYPGPGAQIVFTGNEQRYTLVALTELGEITNDGTLSANLRVSPDLKVRDQLEHGTVAIVRERYSQCRITGHDFLDIGTGNFEETNYPELYSTLYTSQVENEVYEEDGGRVFYTSTDQSGNFRCGELFAVEQATGIVTISADFFDFSGLDELRLGGIRVGGTGAVIREFSTDPTFTADSNNIVPTQRAISRYLANRLSVGGSEIATASFIAGLVRVGPDLIGHTLQGTVRIPVRADFDQGAQVRGSIVAQAMFLRTEPEF